MKAIIQPTFREIVTSQLATLGWSRAELARRSGYTKQMITNCLNQTDMQIGSEVMERLLYAMGLQPELRVQPIQRETTTAKKSFRKSVNHA